MPPESLALLRNLKSMTLKKCTARNRAQLISGKYSSAVFAMVDV